MAEPLLAISGLAAGYGATEVLRDIDLAVVPGEIVAILGANGAGKSTLNRTISGVLRATRGTIRFAGAAIERETPAEIVGRGLIHVPEGRCIFPDLTVARKSRSRRLSPRPRPAKPESRARVYDLSTPRRAARAARRHLVRRRAADAGDRQGLDGRAAAAHS